MTTSLLIGDWCVVTQTGIYKVVSIWEYGEIRINPYGDKKAKCPVLIIPYENISHYQNAPHLKHADF